MGLKKSVNIKIRRHDKKIRKHYISFSSQKKLRTEVWNNYAKTQAFEWKPFPQESRADLFFSTPMRNAASANAAKRVPEPASLPVTAYSLTKAWKSFSSRTVQEHSFRARFVNQMKAFHHTFGASRDVRSNWWAILYRLVADV